MGVGIEVSSELEDKSARELPMLLNTSDGRGGRCSYKVAGRLGHKVARGRSKSPNAVEDGSSATASNRDGVDTPGAMRVAVVSNSKCRMLISNNFRELVQLGEAWTCIHILNEI